MIVKEFIKQLQNFDENIEITIEDGSIHGYTLVNSKIRLVQDEDINGTPVLIIQAIQ